MDELEEDDPEEEWDTSEPEDSMDFKGKDYPGHDSSDSDENN